MDARTILDELNALTRTIYRRGTDYRKLSSFAKLVVALAYADPEFRQLALSDRYREKVKSATFVKNWLVLRTDAIPEEVKTSFQRDIHFFKIHQDFTSKGIPIPSPMFFSDAAREFIQGLADEARLKIKIPRFKYKTGKILGPYVEQLYRGLTWQGPQPQIKRATLKLPEGEVQSLILVPPSTGEAVTSMIGRIGAEAVALTGIGKFIRGAAGALAGAGRVGQVVGRALMAPPAYTGLSFAGLGAAHALREGQPQEVPRAAIREGLFGVSLPWMEKVGTFLGRLPVLREIGATLMEKAPWPASIGGEALKMAGAALTTHGVAEPILRKAPYVGPLFEPYPGEASVGESALWAAAFGAFLGALRRGQTAKDLTQALRDAEQRYMQGIRTTRQRPLTLQQEEQIRTNFRQTMRNLLYSGKFRELARDYGVHLERRVWTQKQIQKALENAFPEQKRPTQRPALPPTRRQALPPAKWEIHMQPDASITKLPKEKVKEVGDVLNQIRSKYGDLRSFAQLEKQHGQVDIVQRISQNVVPQVIRAGGQEWRLKPELLEEFPILSEITTKSSWKYLPFYEPRGKADRPGEAPPAAAPPPTQQPTTSAAGEEAPPIAKEEAQARQPTLSPTESKVREEAPPTSPRIDWGQEIRMLPYDLTDEGKRNLASLLQQIQEKYSHLKSFEELERQGRVNIVQQVDHDTVPRIIKVGEQEWHLRPGLKDEFPHLSILTTRKNWKRIPFYEPTKPEVTAPPIVETPPPVTETPPPTEEPPRGVTPEVEGVTEGRPKVEPQAVEEGKAITEAIPTTGEQAELLPPPIEAWEQQLPDEVKALLRGQKDPSFGELRKKLGKLAEKPFGDRNVQQRLRGIWENLSDEDKQKMSWLYKGAIDYARLQQTGRLTGLAQLNLEKRPAKDILEAIYLAEKASSIAKSLESFPIDPEGIQMGLFEYMGKYELKPQEALRWTLAPREVRERWIVERERELGWEEEAPPPITEETAAKETPEPRERRPEEGRTVAPTEPWTEWRFSALNRVLEKLGELANRPWGDPAVQEKLRDILPRIEQEVLQEMTQVSERLAAQPEAKELRDLTAKLYTTLENLKNIQRGLQTLEERLTSRELEALKQRRAKDVLEAISSDYYMSLTSRDLLRIMAKYPELAPQEARRWATESKEALREVVTESTKRALGRPTSPAIQEVLGRLGGVADKPWTDRRVKQQVSSLLGTLSPDTISALGEELGWFNAQWRLKPPELKRKYGDEVRNLPFRDVLEIVHLYKAWYKELPPISHDVAGYSLFEEVLDRALNIRATRNVSPQEALRQAIQQRFEVEMPPPETTTLPPAPTEQQVIQVSEPQSSIEPQASTIIEASDQPGANVIMRGEPNQLFRSDMPPPSPQQAQDLLGRGIYWVQVANKEQSIVRTDKGPQGREILFEFPLNLQEYEEIKPGDIIYIWNPTNKPIRETAETLLWDAFQLMEPTSRGEKPLKITVQDPRSGKQRKVNVFILSPVQVGSRMPDKWEAIKSSIREALKAQKGLLPEEQVKEIMAPQEPPSGESRLPPKRSRGFVSIPSFRRLLDYWRQGHDITPQDVAAPGTNVEWHESDMSISTWARMISWLRWPRGIAAELKGADNAALTEMINYAENYSDAMQRKRIELWKKVEEALKGLSRTEVESLSYALQDPAYFQALAPEYQARAQKLQDVINELTQLLRQNGFRVRSVFDFPHVLFGDWVPEITYKDPQGNTATKILGTCTTAQEARDEVLREIQKLHQQGVTDIKVDIIHNYHLPSDELSYSGRLPLKRILELWTRVANDITEAKNTWARLLTEIARNPNKVHQYQADLNDLAQWLDDIESTVDLQQLQAKLKIQPTRSWQGQRSLNLSTYTRDLRDILPMYIDSVIRAVYNRGIRNMERTILASHGGKMSLYAIWYLREYTDMLTGGTYWLAVLDKLMQRLGFPAYQRLAARLMTLSAIKYLGLNPAKFIVNLTQPIMMTGPIVGYERLPRAYQLAFQLYRKGSITVNGHTITSDELAKTIGLDIPQTKFLWGYANWLGDAWEKASTILVQPFAAAENINRPVSAIAGFEWGEEILRRWFTDPQILDQLAKGEYKPPPRSVEEFLLKNVGPSEIAQLAIRVKTNPKDMNDIIKEGALSVARMIVTRTQFRYDPTNQPLFIGKGGAAARVLFQYMNFSIKQLENLFSPAIPRDAQLKMLAALLFAAGLKGLPFFDELDWVIRQVTGFSLKDALALASGGISPLRAFRIASGKAEYDDVTQAVQEATITPWQHRKFAQILYYGLPAAAGIDFSQSLGVPLWQIAGRLGIVLEPRGLIWGPPLEQQWWQSALRASPAIAWLVDTITDGIEYARAPTDTNLRRLWYALVPVGIARATQAWYAYKEGGVRSTVKGKVIAEEPDLWEMVVLAFGGVPTRITQINEIRFRLTQMKEEFRKERERLANIIADALEKSYRGQLSPGEQERALQAYMAFINMGGDMNAVWRRIRERAFPSPKALVHIPEKDIGPDRPLAHVMYKLLQRLWEGGTQYGAEVTLQGPAR